MLVVGLLLIGVCNLSGFFHKLQNAVLQSKHDIYMKAEVDF